MDWPIMLVMSRREGEAIVIASPRGQWRVTVSRLSELGAPIEVSIAPPSGAPHQARLERDRALTLSPEIDLRLFDRRGDEVRLAVECSASIKVYRHEAFETFQPGPPRDDPEDGDAGVLARRPPGPRPPGLSVRLDEPRDTDAPGTRD